MMICSSGAQVSYEFMQPLPPDSKRINAVDQSHFGVYRAENSDLIYEFNAAGVFVRSLAIHSVSRETIRESSKYQIKGDYIFGVKQNDSLPCVLEGENYYFGVPKRDTIVSLHSKNELRKIGAGEYFLNYHENGLYTPCSIKFESGKLLMRFFDYPNETKSFAEIKSQQSAIESDMTHVYLLPTLKEWKKIDSSQIFGTPSVFKLEAR
jgi:hypothetical protein